MELKQVRYWGKKKRLVNLKMKMNGNYLEWPRGEKD